MSNRKKRKLILTQKFELILISHRLSKRFLLATKIFNISLRNLQDIQYYWKQFFENLLICDRYSCTKVFQHLDLVVELEVRVSIKSENQEKSLISCLFQK